MNRYRQPSQRARAAGRRARSCRYNGETAVCGSCGTVYFKRDGHSC